MTKKAKETKTKITSAPVDREEIEMLYKKAMKQVKETGQKMIDASHAEAVKFRLASGMDKSGYPIKGYDPETGEKKIPQKRGRKPKSEVVEEKIPVKSTTTETVIKRVKVKPVKVAKTVKKKEKTGIKGRIASAPILKFDGKNNSLNAKIAIFDTAMVGCFGDKYDKKKLSIDGLSITVNKTLTKPTNKNPNGVLLVELSTKDKIGKFYEWDSKFWMSQLLNYSHYMKPIKK